MSLLHSPSQDGNDYCTSQAGAAGEEFTISHRHQLSVPATTQQNSSYISWSTDGIAVYLLQ